MRITIKNLQDKVMNLEGRLKLANDTAMITDKHRADEVRLKDSFQRRCAELEVQNRFTQRILENLSEALKGKIR